MYLLAKFSLFYIITFKSWTLIQSASIYSKDYNIFDVDDNGNNDYWYNYDTNLKRNTKDTTYNEYYPENCKLITYNITTEKPTVITTATTCKSTGSNESSIAEAQDVIDHIMRVLQSMRVHALALIKNMNELEMNILSSSPPSSIEALCKNSTMAISESMNDMEKIIYPDVLSQKPNYSINAWPLPHKVETIPESLQTNDFVSEAQEAVKSWKQQIEICKHILENAIQNALQKGNVKDMEKDNMENIKDPSKFLTNNVNNRLNPSRDLQNTKEHFNLYPNGLKKLHRDLKNQQDYIENSLRSSIKHGYQSLDDISP